MSLFCSALYAKCCAVLCCAAVQLLTMCCWASQATAPATTPVSTPVQHEAEYEEEVFDVEAVLNLVGQYRQGPVFLLQNA